MLLYEHRKAASAEGQAHKYLREASSVDQIYYGTEALRYAIENRKKHEASGFG